MKWLLFKKIAYLKNLGYTLGSIAESIWIQQTEINRLKKIRAYISKEKLFNILENLNNSYDLIKDKDFRTLEIKEKWVCIYSLNNSDNFFLDIDWKKVAEWKKISYFNKNKFYVW